MTKKAGLFPAYSPCFVCSGSASLSAVWSTDVFLNGSSRSVGAWNMSMITSGSHKTRRDVIHCESLKWNRGSVKAAVLTQSFPCVDGRRRQHSGRCGLNEAQWSVRSDVRQVTCAPLWHWDTKTAWKHPQQQAALPWGLPRQLVDLPLSLSSGSGG